MTADGALIAAATHSVATGVLRLRGEMFRLAAAALDAIDVPWCVLHGHAEYPDHVTSDVDLLVGARPADVIRTLLPGLGREMRLVQSIEHEPDATYYVFAAERESRVVFLPLDVSADYRRNGRVFLRAGDVLDGRRREREMWIPPPAAEFAYYLAKKVAKGQLTDAQAASLADLFAADPAGCTTRLRRLFQPEWASVITSALAERNWRTLQVQLPRLRKSLLSTNASRRPLRPASYRLADVARRVRRISHPTGLFVVLLGPDGAGKSTVAARLTEDLAPAFRRTTVFHLRPRLGRLGSAHATPDPHAAPPRSAGASVVKLVYWVADYLLGYALRVWPGLVRSTLVLFDRYYYDLLVDPRRYRYGGPRWLARLFARCVPTPDVTIILDVPAEVLRARKRELTLDEARHQRGEYVRLARALPSSRVVDAARDIDVVVADVESAILDHMARRATERLAP